MSYSRLTPYYKVVVGDAEFFGFSSDVESEFGVPMHIVSRHAGKGSFYYAGRWMNVTCIGKRPKIVG